MPKESKTKSSSSSSKKVSQTVVSQEEPESPSEEEELWDVVRIISTQEKCICRTEGCKKIAVVTWASNLDPQDKWDLCEACQESDFGGWPEDLPPPSDPNDPRHPSSLLKQTSSKVKPSITTPNPSTKSTTAPVTQASQDESEEENKSHTEESPSSSPTPVEQVRDSTCPTPSQTNKDNKGTTTQTTTILSTQDSSEVTTPTPDSNLEPEQEGDNSPPQDSKNTQQEDEAEAEVWNLSKVITLDNLKKDATIKCSTENCLLAACSVWVSNLEPKNKWYSCLDCQEKDFDGWPPVEEMPVKSIQANHLQLIAQKCSNQSKPSLPELPIASSSACSPCPTSKGGSSTTKKNGTHFVTPPPASQQKKKPNPKALAIHNKWQAAAEAIGGKDVRIVVSKPAAKKLISDLLYDAFRPMTITEIYKALKAIVPSPVLSACLQEMAVDKDENRNPFADDSDDEEENTSKVANNDSSCAPSDPFAGSLQLKIGKSQATNLYYVDYNKRKGLDVEERNTLFQNIATADANEASLKGTLKSTIAMADKLLSEPTNEIIAEQLASLGSAVQDLEEKVQEAMKLKVNEKHKQAIKRKIQNMVGQWRRRKRLCMDFLITMEELTDGSVRAKKCFSGDGPIALDSDEIVAKAAVKFAKNKRARQQSQPMKKRKVLKTSKSQNPNSSTSLADDDFVAVNLESQHCVCRVYVDDEN